MCRLAAGSGARPEARRQLEPLLELAERGQHVLTRREIQKVVIVCRQGEGTVLC
jgi:hypothetical protein